MEYNYNQTNLQQPNTLTLGILSIVFASITGIVGIILGAIGRKKGKEFLAQGGELTGASKVGYILSLVGLILGIICTILLVIYVVVVVVVLGKSGAMNYINY